MKNSLNNPCDLTEYYRGVEGDRKYGPLHDTMKQHERRLEEALHFGDEKQMIISQHHLRFIEKVMRERD